MRGKVKIHADELITCSDFMLSFPYDQIVILRKCFNKILANLHLIFISLDEIQRLHYPLNKYLLK